MIRAAQSTDSGPISTLTILTIVLCCEAGEKCAPKFVKYAQEFISAECTLGMPRQACELAGNPSVKLLSCGRVL